MEGTTTVFCWFRSVFGHVFRLRGIGCLFDGIVCLFRVFLCVSVRFVGFVSARFFCVAFLRMDQ